MNTLTLFYNCTDYTNTSTVILTGLINIWYCSYVSKGMNDWLWLINVYRSLLMDTSTMYYVHAMMMLLFCCYCVVVHKFDVGDWYWIPVHFRTFCTNGSTTFTFQIINAPVNTVTSTTSILGLDRTTAIAVFSAAGVAFLIFLSCVLCVYLRYAGYIRVSDGKSGSEGVTWYKDV